jgi:hypothetical protein
MHRAFLLTLLFGMFTLGAIAQDSVTITSDPGDLSRPISTLTDQIRQSEKVSITYEDPRYSNPADIQDVTAVVARNKSEAEMKYGHRTLVPRGRPFSFVYAPNDLRSPESAEATIVRMLQEYGMLGGPTFGVVRDGSRLHIVPVDVLDVAGDRVKQNSILDTVITIPQGQRDGGQLLEAICNQVSKRTGYEIWVGSGAPSNNLARYSTTEGIENETARIALGHLLDRLALPNSFDWDLYYDPGEKAYALNFDYTGPAGPGIGRNSLKGPGHIVK